jgi:hypothetical protein
VLTRRTFGALRSGKGGLRVAATTAAVGYLVAWPLYGELYRHGGDRPIAWDDITTIVGSIRFREQETRVFETEDGLGSYLSRVTGRMHQIVSSGERSRYVLTTVGPRSSNGYQLRVERVVEERARVFVLLREHTPQLGERVRPRVTSPFVLLALPAGDKPVRVELEGRP